MQMEVEEWESMQEELMEWLNAGRLEKSDDSCDLELQYGSSHSGPTQLVTFFFRMPRMDRKMIVDHDLMLWLCFPIVRLRIELFGRKG